MRFITAGPPRWARISAGHFLVYMKKGFRGMDLQGEERRSDSPLVESVWRSLGDESGPFISMAEAQFGLVVTRYRGSTFLTVRGPTTKPTPAYVAADAEYFGIQFRPGVFMPNLPVSMVMERNDLNLPEASGDSFWLESSTWQYPTFENADTFVARLVRLGLLVHDPIVTAILQAQPVDVSIRTVRRRFLSATGLTPGELYQIERARYATALLKQGLPILDVVQQAGYFDQPHLTHALRRFIGLTPAQILDRDRTARLSLLYKTNPFPGATL